MIAFPAVSALISLACAALVAWDARRRPRPDKIAWSIAFAVFTLAASAEVVGSLAGWTPTLARLYYVAGATLVVGYLALGELYLLVPKRIAAIAPGVTLLVTALAITIVFAAPVDSALLDDEAWEAIERGPALQTMTIAINALGTVVLVGGALYSAWRFRRLGSHRHRMIGCVLIAAGTLIVATGGTLARFGHRELLYIPMAFGVATIFAGYLETRRPEPGRPAVPALVSLPSIRPGGRRPVVVDDPGIAFLEARFLPLDDAALAEACRRWSVPRQESDSLTRDEARRVWTLRLRLSPSGQERFDEMSVPTQRQLAELYHDVLAPGMAEVGRATRSVAQGG